MRATFGNGPSSLILLDLILSGVFLSELYILRNKFEKEKALITVWKGYVRTIPYMMAYTHHQDKRKEVVELHL